jgi:hypothetical protein
LWPEPVKRAARSAAADKKVLARYFTQGESASPEDYAQMPDSLKSRWLKNALPEIKQDYDIFGQQGYVAQLSRQRTAAMKDYIKQYMKALSNPYAALELSPGPY